ncbi:TrmH family RNA methyltransferase [Oligoflexus tunisiensis]|uniref:TrmH family RNA methyltransferase n=1 Tax=Oligoflexus tunisiensis TaxID=708132 RepID=UPI00114D1E50|nr:RNA methyltransferase [Oligoflexus tunisiensis]
MGFKPRSTPIMISKNAGKPVEKRPELLYCGLHICETLVRLRKQDIIRVYCTEELLASFGELLRWCAQQKKAYHIVSPADLERITASVHHEGVAILARAPGHGNEQALRKRLEIFPQPFIFLDGVQNPHNIGTIMRVMAHFGWRTLAGHQQLPPLSAATARVSEGGAEFVDTFVLDHALNFLKSLRQLGYRIVGTSSHARTSLYAQPLAQKLCLVMGHEVHGASPEIEALFDDAIVIPGTGAVESLNVAVATGLMLGEYSRLHGVRKDSASAEP